MKKRSVSLKEKKIYDTIDYEPLRPEREDEAKTTDWLEYGQFEQLKQ